MRLRLRCDNGPVLRRICARCVLHCVLLQNGSEQRRVACCTHARHVASTHRTGVPCPSRVRLLATHGLVRAGQSGGVHSHTMITGHGTCEYLSSSAWYTACSDHEAEPCCRWRSYDMGYSEYSHGVLCVPTRGTLSTHGWADPISGLAWLVVTNQPRGAAESGRRQSQANAKAKPSQAKPNVGVGATACDEARQPKPNPPRP